MYFTDMSSSGQCLYTAPNRPYDSVSRRYELVGSLAMKIRDRSCIILGCTLRGEAMPVDLARTSVGKQTRGTWQSTSGSLVRRYQRTFAKAANLRPIQRL